MAYAIQTPPVAVDEAGRTLERALAEIERLRANCHTTGEIRSLEGRLKGATDLLAAYKAQIDRLNVLVESTSGLGTVNAAEHAERIKTFETRLAIERGEVTRLRGENQHLRKTRNVFMGITIGLGVGLVWALTAGRQ